jgi:regulator of sirC expression with transglutaminase-like and TPR domain
MKPSNDASKLEAYSQHLSNLEDYEKAMKGDGKFSEETEKYIRKRKLYLQKLISNLNGEWKVKKT